VAVAILPSGLPVLKKNGVGAAAAGCMFDRPRKATVAQAAPVRIFMEVLLTLARTSIRE
jgi:hypothetical protein